MNRQDQEAPFRARVPTGVSYCTLRVCSLGWWLPAQVEGCFAQFAAAGLDRGVPGDVPVTLRSLVGGDLAGVDPGQHGAAADTELVAQLADGQFALAGDQSAVVVHAETGRCGGLRTSLLGCHSLMSVS